MYYASQAYAMEILSIDFANVFLENYYLCFMCVNDC